MGEILQKTSQEAAKYKPITVEKHLDLEFDLGSLLAVDNNDFDTKSYRYVMFRVHHDPIRHCLWTWINQFELKRKSLFGRVGSHGKQLSKDIISKIIICNKDNWSLDNWNSTVLVRYLKCGSIDCSKLRNSFC